MLSLLNIDRPEVFSLMVKIVAAQTGQILNYSQLANQVGLSFSPLKKISLVRAKNFFDQRNPAVFYQ